MERELKISVELFYENLNKLILSGVTFTAEEKYGVITVKFTGGY